jgi:hypothetical protein
VDRQRDQVTELVSDQSFTWIACAPGIVTTACHVVTPPEADGSARVTASLQQAGPLGQLLGFLTRQLTNRYLQAELRGLKARCEG